MLLLLVRVRPPGPLRSPLKWKRPLAVALKVVSAPSVMGAVTS